MNLQVSKEEYDTILAALRVYQERLDGVALEPSDVEVIATDGMTHEPLSYNQIDTLVERLQFGEGV